MTKDINLATEDDINQLDGDISTVSGDLNTHKGDAANPHNVTAGQVDAPTNSEFDSHKADPSAHHTRYSDSEALNAVEGEITHYSGVSDLQNAVNTNTGNISIVASDLSTHESDSSNPHNVTTNQIGAATQTEVNGIDSDLTTLNNEFNAHETDSSNPHSVTTAQIGAVPTSDVGSANGVASLNSSGVVPDNQIPSLAISNTFVVSDLAARLALPAETGDVAIQQDVNKSYILQGNDPSNEPDWKRLKSPDADVESVFGRTGAVSAESGDYSYSQISGSHGNEDHDVDFATESDLNSHENDSSNPHGVTASQVSALSLSGGTLSGNLNLGSGANITRGSQTWFFESNGNFDTESVSASSVISETVEASDQLHVPEVSTRAEIGSGKTGIYYVADEDRVTLRVNN